MKTTPEQAAEIQAALAEIALDALSIETLDTRNSGSLDFHDCAVWSLKEALNRAFAYGRDIGAAEVAKMVNANA